VCGEPKDVSVSVHNHGVPIPKDAIGGIFEALIRGGADGSDDPNSPNLGLGLYITKEIVAAHGGTIRVTSTEREGTTFTARFPRSGGTVVLAHDSVPQDLTVQARAS
jgi:signal transduction histidine kinase